MDLDHIREHARNASTEGLLDRVTVYRAEVEGPALDIFEAELRGRGVSGVDIAGHAARREREGLSRHADGTVVRCNFCARPATEQRWQWHRLWGWFLPLMPRYVHLCKEHLENPPTDAHGRTLHHVGEEREQGEGRMD